ncbi:cilia- and flagella-associated protein 161-like [Macrobrachium nipponense]|uniref:cilia- and flagella-associated protein 161-like n=1 Tax=Macrobrachium nipponense TaxID=159736 RepID=UPI0030C864E4
MARNSYHSRVRVGNWYENRLMEEDLRKAAERSRTAEKSFQELSAALLEEGDVSVCPDGLLHYGDTVIIHSPVVQPHKGAPRASFPCTLSATPSRYELVHNAYEDVSLTASPEHHQPVLKNVFTITPRSRNYELGSVLCYGDPFDLTHVAVNGRRLYVTSPVGSALHSARESRRQEVLLRTDSSSHSAWRLQPHEPSLRLTYEGQPVEVGARIQLIQTMTNQPMVIEEEFSTNTIFGVEQEVSVGVVNRATTRAASTLALLTWTRRSPPPPPPQELQQEGERVWHGEKDAEEDEEEKEKKREEEEEEDERPREVEGDIDDDAEGIKLALEAEDDDDVSLTDEKE